MRIGALGILVFTLAGCSEGGTGRASAPPRDDYRCPPTRPNPGEACVAPIVCLYAAKADPDSGAFPSSLGFEPGSTYATCAAPAPDADADANVVGYRWELVSPADAAVPSQRRDSTPGSDASDAEETADATEGGLDADGSVDGGTESSTDSGADGLVDGTLADAMSDTMSDTLSDAVAETMSDTDAPQTIDIGRVEDATDGPLVDGHETSGSETDVETGP